MVDEELVQTGGRILGAMAVIGLGIALAAILTAEWISATVVPTLGPAAEEVVTAYTPLAFISIAALAAPVVAGIVGIFEGGRSQTKKHIATVAVACLAGAVVLVMIAGVGVALSDPSGQDAGSGDNGGDDTNDTDDTDNDTNQSDGGGGGSGDEGLTALDLFGLAGLCGVGGMVTGGLTTTINPE